MDLYRSRNVGDRMNNLHSTVNWELTVIYKDIY